MLIFFLIIIYSLIISILYGRSIRTSRSKKRFLRLFFAPLLFLQTFKKTESIPDLPLYAEAYQSAGMQSFSNLIKCGFNIDYSMEPGYIFINKLLFYISGNEHFLYFVIALTILSCYYITMYRYCPFLVLGCFLYLFGPFSQSLFVLRQHLSIALVLMSFPFVIERKFVKFYTVLAVSILLHYTSAVFLPVYFLYQIKEKKKIITLLITGSIALKLVMMIILNFAISLYGSYAIYLNAEGANYKVPLLLFGLILIRIFYTHDEYLRDGISRLLTVLLFVGFAASFAGIGFGPTGRLFMVYTSLIWLIIPQTLYFINKRRLRIIFTVVYLIAAVFMFRSGLQYVEFLRLGF